jgi:hypothetical protein
VVHVDIIVVHVDIIVVHVDIIVVHVNRVKVYQNRRMMSSAWVVHDSIDHMQGSFPCTDPCVAASSLFGIVGPIEGTWWRSWVGVSIRV